MKAIEKAKNYVSDTVERIRLAYEMNKLVYAIGKANLRCLDHTADNPAPERDYTAQQQRTEAVLNSRQIDHNLKHGILSMPPNNPPEYLDFLDDLRFGSHAHRDISPLNDICLSKSRIAAGNIDNKFYSVESSHNSRTDVMPPFFPIHFSPSTTKGDSAPKYDLNGNNGTTEISPDVTK